jgi:tight adherence protein C
MAAKSSRLKEEVIAITAVFALALRGGSTVVSALEQSLENANGDVAERLRLVLAALELGLPLHRAVAEVSGAGSSPEVEELLNKLLVANQTGTGLADQLDSLNDSLAGQVAVAKLARATANETKMLLPLVFLILPVTVLIALFPSIQILNLQLEGMS